MSAANTLTVATCAGLTLELRQNVERPGVGEVSARLLVPEGLAPAGATFLERTAAFFAGGRPVLDVHVEPRASRLLPPVLWLRGAAIDIDDATATSVQAWLESRTQPASAPVPESLPRDLRAPVAPGALA